MPEPRPVTPRTDESAADMGSLIDLGLAEEQPTPSPEPPPTEPQEPMYEPPMYEPPEDAA